MLNIINAVIESAVLWARCCENKFSINTKPENIETNNNTEPAEAVLKSIFSVVSRGAKSEFNEDIFFFLNLVS